MFPNVFFVRNVVFSVPIYLVKLVIVAGSFITAKG